MISLNVSFLNADKYSSRYFRNNRGSDIKNLRCFPQCSEPQHSENGFCGQPIRVQVESFIDKSVEGLSSLISLSNATFIGEFKISGDAKTFTSPVSEDLIVSQVRTKGLQSNPLYKGKVESVIKQESDGNFFHQIFVINFSKDCKSFHYAWHGDNSSGKNTFHNFEVTILFPDSNQLLIPVAHSCSPAFQISCVRRKKSFLNNLSPVSNSSSNLLTIDAIRNPSLDSISDNTSSSSDDIHFTPELMLRSAINYSLHQPKCDTKQCKSRGSFELYDHQDNNENRDSKRQRAKCLTVVGKTTFTSTTLNSTKKGLLSLESDTVEDFPFSQYSYDNAYHTEFLQSSGNLAFAPSSNGSAPSSFITTSSSSNDFSSLYQMSYYNNTYAPTLSDFKDNELAESSLFNSKNNGSISTMSTENILLHQQQQRTNDCLANSPLWPTAQSTLPEDYLPSEAAAKSQSFQIDYSDENAPMMITHMPSNTDSEIDILNSLLDFNFSFENMDAENSDFI